MNNINKLLLLLSIISTPYSMEEINTNNTDFSNINSVKNDLIDKAVEKFTDQIVDEAKQGDLADQIVDEAKQGDLADQIVDEAKQGDLEDKKFLDNEESFINDIKKIIKSVLNGEEIKFGNFNSPANQNAFILYKYLLAYRNYIIDPFQNGELKEFPRINNNKEWMNKESDWYKEAIKELRKKANNIDENKILHDVAIYNRCVAPDFLIYWIKGKKNIRKWLRSKDAIKKHNYAIGYIFAIDDKNFKKNNNKYKVQNKKDIKYIQMNRIEDIEKRFRNVISKGDYYKNQKIIYLSNLYKSIKQRLENDSNLITQLKNINNVRNNIEKLLNNLIYNIKDIDNVKNNVKTLLDTWIYNINYLKDAININDAKKNREKLFNNFQKNMEELLNNLNINNIDNINKVTNDIKKLLLYKLFEHNTDNINKVANDIEILLMNNLYQFSIDNISKVANDIETLLMNNLSEYNTNKRNNIKNDIKKLLLYNLSQYSTDNINNIKNNIEKLINSLKKDKIYNIDHVKNEMGTLLDNLNINNTENNIKKLLDKLDINNIESINNFTQNIKILLDDLNVNNIKNSVSTLLDKLDINNIESIDNVKDDIKILLDGLYKYNLSVQLLPDIKETYLQKYLDNLLVHYDPIKKEYDENKLLKKYFRNGDPHSPITEFNNIPFNNFSNEEFYKIIKKQPEIISTLLANDIRILFAGVLESFNSVIYDKNPFIIPVVKVLSEENSANAIYNKLRMMLPGQPQHLSSIYNIYYQAPQNFFHSLMQAIQVTLAWRNYYLGDNKQNKLLSDSIKHDILLTIGDKKLYLIYNLVNNLINFFEMINEFKQSPYGSQGLTLKNFNEFFTKYNPTEFELINTPDRNKLYNNVFINLFMTRHNNLSENMQDEEAHQNISNNLENTQTQFNKYLNELENHLNNGSPISTDNPLNYENTIGFFKRLIEDYFTEISKKN